MAGSSSSPAVLERIVDELRGNVLSVRPACHLIAASLTVSCGQVIPRGEAGLSSSGGAVQHRQGFCMAVVTHRLNVDREGCTVLGPTVQPRDTTSLSLMATCHTAMVIYIRILGTRL